MRGSSVELGTLACSATVLFVGYFPVAEFAKIPCVGGAMAGSELGNIGMFRYGLVREICGYLRPFAAIRGYLRPFAAICVEIFGRLIGSWVSNREHWHVPLRFCSGDSRPFAAIRGHSR